MPAMGKGVGEPYVVEDGKEEFKAGFREVAYELVMY